jgi:hypothetical protein
MSDRLGPGMLRTLCSHVDTAFHLTI